MQSKQKGFSKTFFKSLLVFLIVALLLPALVVFAVTTIGTNISTGGTLTVTGTTTLSSMTAGSVLFAGTGGAVSQNNSKLFWDNTNNRLGVGTSGPDRVLDILDASNPQLRLTYTDGSIYSEFQTDSNGDLTITASGGDISFNDENLSTSGSIQAGTLTDGTFSVSSGAITGLSILTLEGGTYDTILQVGTPTASVTYTWPAADGTDGDVLTTNASGALSWTTPTVYADRALSNLSSVAINASLVSDTDSTDDLGSSSIYWANAYIDKIYLDASTTLEPSSGLKVKYNTSDAYFKFYASSDYFQFRINQSVPDLTFSSSLSQLKMNLDVVPSSDSSKDLGSSSLYWAEGYIDKVYLNSTATLDGATAGEIAITGYLKITTNAGTPASADCDADVEAGRQVLDTTNNRLYICNGATRGWDYINLSN